MLLIVQFVEIASEDNERVLLDAATFQEGGGKRQMRRSPMLFFEFSFLPS